MGEVFQGEGEVEEGLDLVGDAAAVLAGGGGLQLAVEGLVDDAVARVLAAALGLLAVAVALVEFLGQELEELVRVLLLGRDEVLEGLLLADPEAREDVGGRVAVGALERVEVLEHVVHGAAQAVLRVAVAALVAVAEVVVAQDGVVQEALEDDVLVAGRAGVVDAPEAAGLARRGGRVGRDVGRVVPDGVRRLEQLLVLALAVWGRSAWS